MGDVCPKCLGQMTTAQPVVFSEKLWFTVKEFMDILSISERTVYYRIKNSELAIRREGKRGIRIHRAELLRYSRMDHPPVQKAKRKKATDGE